MIPNPKRGAFIMLIKEKLINAVKSTSDNVILRHELSSLGSQSQITDQLRELVESGFLMRIGVGVYGKNKEITKFKNKSNSNFYISIINEIFKKLSININEIKLNHHGKHEEFLVDTGKNRISRKLEINGISISYRNKSAITKLKDINYLFSVNEIPSYNVSGFIKKIAELHGVKYKRTGLDDFAESVTRLAGDDIELDLTEKLLVELRKKEIINGPQLARLMTNYIKECENVRSIR